MEVILIKKSFGDNTDGVIMSWFEKWKIKKNDLPQVNIITQWDKTDENFYVPGALVCVENGKGTLCAMFSEEPDEATYYTLMFQDKPIFQFQGDEYYCPTCEKIVRSGYQLEQTEEFHIEKLNSENIAFSEVLEELMPLLGLLSDNYYVVLDTELYPTDGNGHLFWNVPNSNKRMQGSCLYYRGNCEWGKLRPHFTIATESPQKMCKDRVDYYREHPDCRAVAFYMDGYLTALIDGHHKAMAAALEHRTVPALVIMPCYTLNYKEKEGGYKSYIAVGDGDMRFSCDTYSLKDMSCMGDKVSKKKMDHILSQIPNTDFGFPYDNDELVSYYPDVEEISIIDEVEEISDEYLDQIVSEKHICTNKEISNLVKGLSGLKHPRLFEVADFFLSNCSYTCFLRNRDVQTVEDIVKVLLKRPRNDELEQYLLELMIEYEDEYPLVGKMIIEYL